MLLVCHTGALEEFWASEPVSRVLYPDCLGAVTIHLAPVLPPGSSDQPEGIGRAL